MHFSPGFHGFCHGATARLDLFHEFVCNLAYVLFGAVLIFRHDYRQASFCASMMSPSSPTSSKRKPIFSASSQVTSMGWPRFKAS